MKIVQFEVVHVRPRSSFLTVHTDEGIVGVHGEACLEGKARVVETAVREFDELLGGQDPQRIEHLWNLMYRWTFYPSGSIRCSAISAIGQALWDILGKHLGAPVHVLLGGAVRDRVRSYQHVNVGDWGPFDRSTKDEHIEQTSPAPRPCRSSPGSSSARRRAARTRSCPAGSGRRRTTRPTTAGSRAWSPANWIRSSPIR